MRHQWSTNVDQLIRFANGYYMVEPTGRGVAVDVLRFGQVGGWQQPQASFVFRYNPKPIHRPCGICLN